MEGLPQVLEAKSRLTGDDLRSILSAATRLMERNIAAVNALNVFPVPDGDTGTNMFLTLREVVEKAHTEPGAPASEVAAVMARSALMGARGNSGVILSQFFKGMAVGLEGAKDLGPEELATAYRAAKEYSYKAVGEPVEGTMLTVISAACEASQEALVKDGTLLGMCEAAYAAARESVAQTPTMLEVLREAGVVDAGGQGLSVILEGVRRFVAGESLEAQEIATPEPIGVEGSTGAVSVEFVDAVEQELYGYCTQFIVQGQGLDVDEIRGRMSELAQSTVIVGDDTVVKVHVHAEDPGPVLTAAVSHGTLARVSIQNMDEQHVEFSGDRRADVAAKEAAVTLVAVASGKGLEALFTNLGASRIITGGDTMNPSVQELVEAVETAASEAVIILPNNGNIVPAAVQAAEYSKKSVKVVRTRSIPQGVAAALSFNPDRDVDSVVGEMDEAAGSVRTGEITEAVRSVTLSGVEVEPGRLIGLLERELVAAGDQLEGVLTSVLQRAALSDGELVTLYRGEPVTSHDADAVMQKMNASFPEVDFELVEGGQPHYHFFISIE